MIGAFLGEIEQHRYPTFLLVEIALSVPILFNKNDVILERHSLVTVPPAGTVYSISRSCKEQRTLRVRRLSSCVLHGRYPPITRHVGVHNLTLNNYFGLVQHVCAPPQPPNNITFRC